MNDHQLYHKLLLRFHASEADFARSFRLSRHGDDDPSASTRLAHTLRGTAGNIGAKDVQATAAALERACADNASPEVIDQLLSRTLEALSPVMNGLAALRRTGVRPVDPDRPNPDRAEPADADIETVRGLLTRLTALLEDNNLEAGDVVEELAASVAGTTLEEAVGNISRAVARFDVDTGIDALRKMAERIARK
jgi:two-component system, sensor histidine kinase and response regulator